MHSNRLIISHAAETWTVHALHARDQPRRREECYLKWKCSGSWADSGLRWQSGVIPGGNAAVTVFFFLLLAAFCYLCPSPSFVLFFPVYGLAVVEGGRGSGWEEKWWWFQAVARLSFLLLLCAEPAVSVFFFFPLCSVLFLFSLSGSAGVGSVDGGRMTVLLWQWRGSTAVVPRWWGTVLLLLCAETAVSVFPSPRLFSLSLLCISNKSSSSCFSSFTPLSLFSFSLCFFFFLFGFSLLCFQMFSSFLFSKPSLLQNFAPPGVPLFLRKCPLFLSFSLPKNHPPLVAGSSSGIYKQRRRGSPYHCHGAG